MGPTADEARIWTFKEFFSYAKGAVLAVDGVATPEEAERVRDWEVFLPEEAVGPDAPDAFFTDEVLGFPVTDSRRGRIGTVIGVDEGRAYWMIRAKGETGEFEIPAVKGLGVVVDLKDRSVRVDLPDGYPGLEEGSDAD
jgi:ribosomal 30S subunit maturation factor RimM